MFIIILGFIISLAAILIISRKNLALAIISGAILLGLFTLPLSGLWDQLIYTVTDISIILLSLAMALIPLIGGVMKESRQIDDLVYNVRLKKKYLLPFSAALMGLLPMPGGALLSAPILERAGQGVDRALIAAINNWFRHLFILIYPLAPALIVATNISDLDVYQALIYILPAAVAALILGYVFFLRHVEGDFDRPERFSARRLLVPLTVILSAPILDFTLKRIFDLGSLATLIGVSTGLILSIVLSRTKLNLTLIIRNMKPWNFGLIIFGMFLYLHIFQQSGVGALIERLPLPPLLLAVIAGFILSLLTGRVQLPASIILPVYLSSAGEITPLLFALIYVSMYFGYIISPVHPCLVVTCQYFHITIRKMICELAVPTVVVFALTLLITLLIIC